MSEPTMGRFDGKTHILPARVYYEDTDVSGIVYHANYLRFMERGRTNYLRLLGADQRALFAEAVSESPGFAFVVRAMQLDFLKPARMDDILDVVTVPEEVKGASQVPVAWMWMPCQPGVRPEASTLIRRPVGPWRRSITCSPASRIPYRPMG